MSIRLLYYKASCCAREAAFDLIHGRGVEANSTDMTIVFHDGSTIMIGGPDEPKSIKSMAVVDGPWLEEAGEFSIEDMEV